MLQALQRHPSLSGGCTRSQGEDRRIQALHTFDTRSEKSRDEKSTLGTGWYLRREFFSFHSVAFTFRSKLAAN